jgi:tryptophan 2,3-dioxygenase
LHLTVQRAFLYGMSTNVTYASYLQLHELLNLQRPLSDPEQPDELLFIIVHQASELWFKAILHEFDGLFGALEQHDHGQALWRLQRVNALMHIVSAQLSALETLPPQHFAKLRTYLGTSSGVQSVQFRAIEFASGLRDEHTLRALESADVPAIIHRLRDRPTLEELFLSMLAASGVSVEDLYLGPGPGTLFFVAEALLEYEQQFARWRFTHVQLVERVIGPMTRGTGGTAGASYLMRTVDQRFFPKLWAARVRLV